MLATAGAVQGLLRSNARHIGFASRGHGCLLNSSLTLRSSGRTTAGFAVCGTPLNSNVRLFELFVMAVLARSAGSNARSTERHDCREVGGAARAAKPPAATVTTGRPSAG